MRLNSTAVHAGKRCSTGITDVDLSSLEAVGNDFASSFLTALKKLALPRLRSMGGNLEIKSLDQLSTFYAPVLTLVGGYLWIADVPELVSLCDVGLKRVAQGFRLEKARKLVRGDAGLLAQADVKSPAKCSGMPVTIKSQDDYNTVIKDPDFMKAKELGHVTISDSKITADQVEVRGERLSCYLCANIDSAACWQ